MNNNKFFLKTKLYLYKTNQEMKCLLIPIRNSTTVTVSMMINSGSRCETESYGIAHFLEHMAFKGTKTRTTDNIFDELDIMGTICNAYTYKDYTIYFISGDPRDVYKILDIILDLYLNPIYPEEEIIKEKKVILEELTMKQSNSEFVIFNKIYKNIYKDVDEGLSRPEIGNKESIENINREDLIKYRDKYYNISKCVLCVCGNFIKKDIKKKIKEYFKTKLYSISTKVESKDYKINVSNKLDFKYIYELKKDIIRHINLDRYTTQTHIYLFFNSTEINNTNKLVIDLICYILSVGYSSMLFNLLRNKLGVSYSFDCYNYSVKKYGNIIIYLRVNNNSILNTIEELLKELNNMRINGITLMELNKAKKNTQTSLLFYFKDPYNYMMYYGTNVMYDLPLYNISEIMNNIQKITLEEINTAIKYIFNNKNIIIGTIGNNDDDMSDKINDLLTNSFK